MNHGVTIPVAVENLNKKKIMILYRHGDPPFYPGIRFAQIIIPALKLKVILIFPEINN